MWLGHGGCDVKRLYYPSAFQDETKCCHIEAFSTARERYLLDNDPAETVCYENDAFRIFTTSVKGVVARLCGSPNLVLFFILGRERAKD